MSIVSARKDIFSKRTNWNKEQNSVINLLEELKSAKIKITDLTKSNPTECSLIFPKDELLRALENADNLIYKPDPKGHFSAREIIARYYQDQGVKFSAEQIVLTSSTSEGYSYLFRLLADVDDEILFPSPSYPLFPFLAELNDTKLVYYNLYHENHWAIDMEHLLSVLSEKTKAIVLVNPNNPTGSFVSDEDLNRINNICAEHNLSLICDEVFLDYAIDDSNQKESLVKNKKVLTFVLNGLSKMLGLPQMKLSWIAVTGPDQVVGEALKRLEIISDTYLSVNAPAQNALKEWFVCKDNIQLNILNRIKQNSSLLQSEMGKLPGCALPHTQGGWYAVIKIDKARNEEDFVLRLLKEDHVYIHPGYFYDFKEDGYFVVSLLPESLEFKKGIKKLGVQISQL